MPIKMRNNKDRNAVCCECGQTRKEVLGMFDVCIGKNIFTICDVCDEVLLYKTLRAKAEINGRIKSKEDMVVINKRRNRK